MDLKTPPFNRDPAFTKTRHLLEHWPQGACSLFMLILLLVLIPTFISTWLAKKKELPVSALSIGG